MDPIVAEPIAQVSSFTDFGLSAGVMNAIAKMGIDTPTPIQSATLPPLLDGKDVIGQARTGSGKTLAFGIPAIEFTDVTKRAVQVLVLTPTRELAVQIGGVFEALGAQKKVKVGLIYGGRAMGPQRMMLKQGVHIVVGTPGRVLDLLSQGALWLGEVRLLVLDEADEMLDRGFAPDVERIMSRVTSARQTALFSATFSEWIRKTIDRHLDRPVTISVDTKPEDVPSIEHVVYDLGPVSKFDAIADLLDNRPEGSTIVFGKTKHGVKKLARQLELAGYPVAALQGNLSQNARDLVMEHFRSGKVEILLATNVAARGLDVSHVGLVVNADLPESSDLLTHRIGRTGRMGREGQAITLLAPEDGPKWRQIERGLGKRIARLNWQGGRAAVNGSPEITAAIQNQTTGTARPETRPTAQRPAAVPMENRQAPVDRAPRETRQGFDDAPRRSPEPRTERRFDSPRPRQDDADRPVVTVACTECGQPAELRFVPDPTRPVYCSTCFSTRRQSRRPAGSRA